MARDFIKKTDLKLKTMSLVSLLVIGYWLLVIGYWCIGLDG